MRNVLRLLLVTSIFSALAMSAVAAADDPAAQQQPQEVQAAIQAEADQRQQSLTLLEHAGLRPLDLYCPARATLSCPSTTTGFLGPGSCIDSLFDSYGDKYLFNGIAGQTVTIDMTSSAFAVFPTLFSPSHSYLGAGTVLSSFAGTGFSHSRISLVLPSSGVYTVEAQALFWYYSSQPHGGAYALSIAGCSGSPPPPPPTGCSITNSSLCLLSNRFRVEVNWRVPSQGTSGFGHAVTMTSDTGHFWFFSSTNVELVVKVLDGRPVNGRYWVFFGALSDVEYTITVTDTATGAVKTYTNPQGRLASVADTSAF